MLLSIPAALGYPALGALILGESAGLPLPGETALITAGGLAAAGHLSLPLVVLVAAATAIVGDTIGYALGRRRGRALLLRDGFMAGHRRHAVAVADRFFASHGTATVFFGRWVPGLRVVGAVMAGATRMPWRRFALANALGAVTWATTVAGLAALLGPAGAGAMAATGMVVGAVGTVTLWWKARRAVGPDRAGRAVTERLDADPLPVAGTAMPSFGAVA